MRMVPKYITIHEVSLELEKTPSSYDMEYYRHQIFNQVPTRIHIGYHYLVSDCKVYQFLPDDEKANHTGTYGGNNESIGIERLVNRDVNFERAIDVQAKLTATLMKKYNIPITKVVTHNYWKPLVNCPSRMLNGQYGGWKIFIMRVNTYFKNREFFEEVLEKKH